MRILVMDDAPEVRHTVKSFLATDGYTADEAGTVRELLERLTEREYDLVFLDILLEHDVSIGETHSLTREYFPHVTMPHDEILDDLALSSHSPASGLYLLPVIKAVSPQTRVIMLTATWEGAPVEQSLRKWGSEVTVLKCGEDRDFTPTNDLYGLGAELRGFVARLEKVR
jgi:CheY-like chemotaxis protein